MLLPEADNFSHSLGYFCVFGTVCILPCHLRVKACETFIGSNLARAPLPCWL